MDAMDLDHARQVGFHVAGGMGGGGGTATMALLSHADLHMQMAGIPRPPGLLPGMSAIAAKYLVQQVKPQDFNQFIRTVPAPRANGNRNV